MIKEFCVTWKRPGGKVRRKIYQTYDGATAFFEMLTTHPDQWRCLRNGNGCNYCIVCDGALEVPEFVELQEREVATWSEVGRKTSEDILKTFAVSEKEPAR